MEVKPTYLPSVPRVFEKIYTLAHGAIEAKPAAEREQAEAAIALGVKVRNMMARGEDGARGLAEPRSTRRTRAVQKRPRDLRRRRAPGDQRRRADRRVRSSNSFSACGVPVLEGYGMTETATAATFSTVENHRFGTVGRALPGVELKIADDGEILIKGAEHLRRLPQPGLDELRRRRERLAAHR